MRADNNGGVYWAGKLSDDAPFDTITAGTTVGSSLNFYIARLDTAGTVLWARALDANASNQGQPGKTSFLEVDHQHNAIVTGYLRGSHDFGNNIQANTGGVAQHQFVVQCSPGGQINWLKTAGGTSSLFQGHSVARAANGNIFVAGLSRHAVDLDTISLAGSSTNYYPVVARLGTAVVSAAGTAISGGATLNLYPNPASGIVMLQAAENLNLGHVVITDLAGKAIFSATATQTQQLQIDTKGWPAGMYFVRVTTAAGLQVLKLQKQ
ncbi:MAG: T9SS type A sorting domain-containing protein [Sphingobacteriales bacterium]|nr:MAG: T9SS type A sorting domain-containing protein [Sphingobacteriales bacterium]